MLILDSPLPHNDVITKRVDDAAAKLEIDSVKLERDKLRKELDRIRRLLAISSRNKHMSLCLSGEEDDLFDDSSMVCFP